MRERTTGQVVLAFGVIALGAVAGYQTTLIPVSPIYSRIGPTIFPYAVAVGLVALGLALLWQAWRGDWPLNEEDAELPIDWRAVGWVLAGLVLNVALIQPLGFIIASTLLFCCIARAFGSSRLGRDLVVAIALAAVTYVGFDRVLGISIGAGIFEGLL